MEPCRRPCFSYFLLSTSFFSIILMLPVSFLQSTVTLFSVHQKIDSDIRNWVCLSQICIYSILERGFLNLDEKFGYRAWSTMRNPNTNRSIDFKIPFQRNYEEAKESLGNGNVQKLKRSWFISVKITWSHDTLYLDRNFLILETSHSVLNCLKILYINS